MDTRTIIAMALMVVIYFYFFAPKPKEESKTPSSTTQVQTKEANSVQDPEPKALKNQQLESNNHQMRGQILELKNDRVLLKVNALGEVVDLSLLHYTKEINSTENVGWNFDAQGSFNSQSLEVSHKPINWKLASYTDRSIHLKASQDGADVSRKIELAEDSYLLKVTDEIKNQKDRSLTANVNLALRKAMDPEKMKRSFFNPYGDVQQAVWSKDDSLSKDNFETVLKKDKQGLKVEGQLDWVGFSTRYFFLGLVPEDSYLDSLTINSRVFGDGKGNFAVESFLLPEKQIEPNSTVSFEYKYYFGPKKIEELKKAGHNLEHVIDYTTMIGFITKPISRLLLALLLFFQSIVKNYGLAIILLTIIVKSLLLPLAWKASLGMRKMAQIQPKVAEIRERYKKDPQRMQAETMKLWKTEKANPFGSCLPMLVQIPVFFSLYPVFFVSIEMRQAGFFGWIHDLSAKDPYYILPIVLTLVMFAQMKLTPQPGTGMGGDNEAIKVQKAMFKIMPVMMGVFSLFMPAGLSLYILVNVLFSFVQQYFFNKRLDEMYPRPIPSVVDIKKSNGSSA